MRTSRPPNERKPFSMPPCPIDGSVVRWSGNELTTIMGDNGHWLCLWVIYCPEHGAFVQRSDRPASQPWVPDSEQTTYLASRFQRRRAADEST